MSAPDTDRPPSPVTDPTPADDHFLARWSRRKRAAEAGQRLPEPAPQREQAPTILPSELPEPSTLRFEDDFSAYLGAKVPAALKRAALSKLFSDPSFNQMDGLDVYIEDYNLVPNLSREEARLLTHARETMTSVLAKDDISPSGGPAYDSPREITETGEPPKQNDDPTDLPDTENEA